jgi:ribosomal-protein-alanine N-acetyltransferase
MSLDSSYQFMLLETERLVLRPYEECDIDEMHRIWMDPDVRRYLWDGSVIDRERAAQTVRASLTDWERYGLGQWTVRFTAGGGIIGFCGFRQFGEPPQWEIIYGLLPAYWGRGLAVEASIAALRFAFSVTGSGCIHGRTDPPNTASIRVLEKLGMSYVGQTLEGGLPIVTYSISREDFHARYQ